MSLILRQVIGYQQGKRASSTSTNPLLKNQLEQTQKQLNQILNKWKFDDQPITTSQEFLDKFTPWINSQLEKQKDLKLFLAKKGVNNLQEAETKLTNRDLSEGEELTILNQELTQVKKELAQAQETFKNTEEDYLKRIEEQDQELQAKIKEFQTSNGELLKRIEELRENQTTAELSPEDKEKLDQYEDLISERDEAIRKQKEAEQDLLATNNRLRNKAQEASNKDQALEKLKKETNQKELNHQKQLKEKNGLITTLNQEIKQHKERYSKQGKLLDEEQLECKKLEEKVEQLTEKNKELENENKDYLKMLVDNGILTTEETLIDD